MLDSKKYDTDYDPDTSELSDEVREALLELSSELEESDNEEDNEEEEPPVGNSTVTDEQIDNLLREVLNANPDGCNQHTGPGCGSGTESSVDTTWLGNHKTRSGNLTGKTTDTEGFRFNRVGLKAAVDMFYSKDKDYAESFGEEVGGKGEIIHTKSTLTNPLHVLASRQQFSDPAFENPIIKIAKEKGYDGIIFAYDHDKLRSEGESDDNIKDYYSNEFYVKFGTNNSSVEEGPPKPPVGNTQVTNQDIDNFLYEVGAWQTYNANPDGCNQHTGPDCSGSSGSDDLEYAHDHLGAESVKGEVDFSSDKDVIRLAVGDTDKAVSAVRQTTTKHLEEKRGYADQLKRIASNPDELERVYKEHEESIKLASETYALSVKDAVEAQKEYDDVVSDIQAIKGSEPDVDKFTTMHVPQRPSSKIDLEDYKADLETYKQHRKEALTKAREARQQEIDSLQPRKEETGTALKDALQVVKASGKDYRESVDTLATKLKETFKPRGTST